MLDHFWCQVVILVTFSSNLDNFEKNVKINTEKIQKKYQKFQNLFFFNQDFFLNNFFCRKKNATLKTHK